MILPKFCLKVASHSNRTNLFPDVCSLDISHSWQVHYGAQYMWKLAWGKTSRCMYVNDKVRKAKKKKKKLKLYLDFSTKIFLAFWLQYCYFIIHQVETPPKVPFQSSLARCGARYQTGNKPRFRSRAQTWTRQILQIVPVVLLRRLVADRLVVWSSAFFKSSSRSGQNQ